MDGCDVVLNSNTWPLSTLHPPTLQKSQEFGVILLIIDQYERLAQNAVYHQKVDQPKHQQKNSTRSL
jgi:hypothetical protein